MRVANSAIDVQHMPATVPFLQGSSLQKRLHRWSDEEGRASCVSFVVHKSPTPGVGLSSNERKSSYRVIK